MEEVEEVEEVKDLKMRRREHLPGAADFAFIRLSPHASCGSSSFPLLPAALSRFGLILATVAQELGPSTPHPGGVRKL